MPPRSVGQSRETKNLFRAKIKEKVAREKAALRQRVDEEVPSWLAWAVKPLANLMDSQKRLENDSQEQSGEDRVAIGKIALKKPSTPSQNVPACPMKVLHVRFEAAQESQSDNQRQVRANQSGDKPRHMPGLPGQPAPPERQPAYKEDT